MKYCQNFSVSIAPRVHIYSWCNRLLSSPASWNKCDCVHAVAVPHCSSPLQTVQSTFCFCPHGPTRIHIPCLSKALYRHINDSHNIVLFMSQHGTPRKEMRINCRVPSMGKDTLKARLWSSTPQRQMGLINCLYGMICTMP